MFWRVQEIFILMGTKIFQIGQRGAEKMKFKNFKLCSKKDSFHWFFVFSKVGKHLWTFVFFCILGQKSGVFVIIGKEIPKTHTTFVIHSLLIHSMVCQHYSIFWSYPVFTDIFKAKIFLKHLLLLIQERLWWGI